MSEAEQIVKAVRGNGQPAWYVLFNDEGHGFRQKVNNDYFNAAAMLFWQQYLLDDCCISGGKGMIFSPGEARRAPCGRILRSILICLP